MEKYIVAYMVGNTDYYRVFIEQADEESPLDLATVFYNELLRREDTYSANLCQIITSTDYFD